MVLREVQVSHLFTVLHSEKKVLSFQKSGLIQVIGIADSQEGTGEINYLLKGQVQGWG